MSSAAKTEHHPRKLYVHLSDEQRADVKRRLDAGESHAKVAADYDVCRTTITKIARGTRERRRVEVGKSMRIRILPDNNNDQPYQSCEKLHTRLTVAACAARWQASKGEGREESRYPACKGCPIGARNQRRLEIEYQARKMVSHVASADIG